MKKTNIHIRLRELAEAKDLNMSQVQIGAGVSMGSIRRYWYNDADVIHLEVLESLCKLLDVTPGDLLEYVPPDA